MPALVRALRPTHERWSGLGHEAAGGAPAGRDCAAPRQASTTNQARPLIEHADRLIGVFGNNDHGALRERLPEMARVEIEGVRFGVIHETGPAKGRENRCSSHFPDLDVLVFGHSHIPWDTTASTGLRLLNPGSPTDRRRQPACTYLTVTVHDGATRDVKLHDPREVGPTR
jgi:putative phosphoesterase